MLEFCENPQSRVTSHRHLSLLPQMDLDEGCLHELFEAQADVRPDAVAILCGQERLSYAQLEKAANQLAHYLRAQGVGPGSLVGLFYERSSHPIVAILACLKAGAAYIPLDTSHPDERLSFILREAEVTTLLTEVDLAHRARSFFASDVIATDANAQEIDLQPSSRLKREDTGLAPEDLCYVIFTSGTTGRPKGVMTEHRNAFHFVQSFNQSCTTVADDRIYQGFSLSFDGSVEEIWMAFSNGAALVLGDRHTPKFGNDVAKFLADSGVTYFSTVPTMLSTITDDIPTLRQIVVSGEACPPDLVGRWAREGREILNVYGPTEATVNSTAAFCRPGTAITIGRPLAGYTAHILDEGLQPVASGQKGELFVGGAGVARGYLKQPELTAERFVVSCDASGKERRLYRTGDLARFNDDGELEFFGRIDQQVKIRGFRVELAEIEALLLEYPGIRSAAVKLTERDGVQVLAAYIVMKDDQNEAGTVSLDRDLLLDHLRAKLPDYMVPAYLDVLADLPMLVSGKVDRSRLPNPRTALLSSGAVLTPPATDMERMVAAIWANRFGLEQVSTDQDFFTDLGGHSLLAAQVATRMRDQGIEVAVRDLYQFRTIASLAAHVEKNQKQPLRLTRPPLVTKPASQFERATVYLLQLVTLPITYAMGAIPLTMLILRVAAAISGRDGWRPAVDLALILTFGFWPLLLLLSVASKWLLIGRYKAGCYPLWSFYYFRWWLAGKFQAMSGSGALAGTPLMAWYYRLLGARVGKNSALDTNLCSSWDLVSIGNDSSIGADTQLLGYRVERGMLILGRVDIGNGCFIGTHSALGLNVTMKDGSCLDDQSFLPDDSVLGPGETRRGSPAQPGEVKVPEEVISHGTKLSPGALACLQILATYALGFLLALPALGATVGVIYAVLRLGGLAALAIAAILTPTMTLVYCFWIALLKSLILRRARPGVYPLGSFFYLRKWLADGLMRTSRSLLLPLFTTLYLPPWLRLLGARIGRRAEMSAIWSFAPELLVVGEESFFADGCILGGRRTYRGRFEIGENRIGRRTFVGNSAILPVGASLGDQCLLGVLSAPPQGQRTEDKTEWLGSPAFRLPNRQKVGGFGEQVTFRPGWGLFLQRAIIDGLRVLIPGFALFTTGLAAVMATLAGARAFGTAFALGWSPFLAILLSLAVMFGVVALKWVTMGRFKPVVVPLWSRYVWFNEMVNGVYESLMAPVIAPLLGTPFLAPCLRLLGCRIGKRCYLGSTLFSEFDLVRIGDEVALNAGAIIQTHLFEDRIMKSSTLTIEDGSSVGNMGVVLYDAVMQKGSCLGPLSLLMKGETIATGVERFGIPTVQDARDLQVSGLRG